METLKKVRSQEEKDSISGAHCETAIYCPFCAVSRDRQEGWILKSETTHDSFSVQACCTECGEEWWVVSSTADNGHLEPSTAKLKDKDIDC